MNFYISVYIEYVFTKCNSDIQTHTDSGWPKKTDAQYLHCAGVASKNRLLMTANLNKSQSLMHTKS